MRSPRTSWSCVKAPQPHALTSVSVRPPLPSRSSLIAASSSTLESSRSTVSMHPDALRRRMEYENMQKQREAQRTTDMECERIGKKWWHTANIPSNLQTISDPAEFSAMLSQAASDSTLMVVNYFAEECYTCKTLYPKVKQLANTYPNVRFVKANGSSAEMQTVLEELGITRVPYFQLYRSGKVLDHFTASLSPEKLAKLRLAVQSHA